MTPHPKYPGIFVEEVLTGMRTIDRVSTSVTAFVGAASRGRSYRAVRINSFRKFEQRFGGLVSNYDLGYAVQQFFLNGGKDAWVVRVARQLTAAKFIKGIHALDAVDIFNLLVIPGVVNSEALSAAADYCRQRRAFLILDAPKSAETPAQMAQAVRNATLPKTSYGAAYFPWIKIPDPLNSRKLRLTPPSGSIAGLFARTDKFARRLDSAGRHRRCCDRRVWPFLQSDGFGKRSAERARHKLPARIPDRHARVGRTDTGRH